MAMSSLMRSRSLHTRFRALFSTKQTPSIFAWGAGNFGQLGNGHTTDPNQTESLGETVRKNTTGIIYSERFPIEISYVGGKTEDDRIVQVGAGGDASGALTAGGQLYLWGNNTRGTLAPFDEDLKYLTYPYKVEQQGVKFTSFDISEQHCVAVTSDGEVYTWGQNRSTGPLSIFGGFFGQSVCKGLGHSDGAPTEYPTRVNFPVAENLKISQVACGSDHTLALTDDGEVWAWGSGEFGRLGNGWHSDVLEPEPVEVLQDVGSCKFIACGQAFSAAITDDGKLFTWGRNDQGQLGCPGSANLDLHNMEAIPVQINIPPVKTVSCGHGHTLAITEAGKLYGWGMKRQMEPAEVFFEGEDETFIEASCGDKLSAVVAESGSVYSWGKGSLLGGTANLRNKFPELVISDKMDLYQISNVVCGKNHVITIGTERE